MKTQILESMKTLIKEGKPLTTENYNRSNPSAFKEFADDNGYGLNEVVEVYNENQEELTELWKEVNE